jgi:hypothetical protein
MQVNSFTELVVAKAAAIYVLRVHLYAFLPSYAYVYIVKYL